jgi:threonine dehydratase
MDAPCFSDVLSARRQIAPYLAETPTYRYPSLDELTGCKVWVKHENHQPTGAFKVRGAINLISRFGADERDAGVIAASTGNHGTSVAFAARAFGVRAVICLPEGANPAKSQRMRNLGAEIVFHGRNFDEAKEHCERLAKDHGYRYIHSGDEPLLIAGVATETLEIIEAVPDIECIVVPVGGGSGAAGACIVANTVNPTIEVIGVQSDAARSAYTSWKKGELVDEPNHTFAEGLATGSAFALPQEILHSLLDDFLLVIDDEIRRATAAMIGATQNLCESAGAAGLAAVVKHQGRFAGRKVALILSGGNISLDQLSDLLCTCA